MKEQCLGSVDLKRTLHAEVKHAVKYYQGFEPECSSCKTEPKYLQDLAVLQRNAVLSVVKD